MKKDTANLAKSTMELQEDLDKLTVDEVNTTKTEEPEIQEISLEQKCKNEGIPYIKPKRRLSPPLGTLPNKIKEEHKRGWEYVKGIYENYQVPGEEINFSLCLYPGDADYLWSIPSNVPVAIPRMVAKHLEEVQQYHLFDHRKKSPDLLRSDSFTHSFEVTGIKYRGKFRPIGAFA